MYHWLEKNLQGDIISVYNNEGTKLLTYSYDAWGITTKEYTSISAVNTAAGKNPFTYRGYYFDTDLRLYYLQSRYYDANTGRFISPDTTDVLTAIPMALTDKNLYAYCDNNPVMRVDEDGEFWNIIIGAVVGAAVNLVASVVSEIIEGDFNFSDLAQVGISTAIGAVEGALIAIYPGASIAISAIASATDAAINDIIDEKNLKTIVVDSIVSGAIGAAAGAGGTSFSKGGKIINEGFNSLGNAIGKGIHPAVRKAAEKTVKKAFTHILKSTTSELVENLAYNGISSFASWYINIAISRVSGG